MKTDRVAGWIVLGITALGLLGCASRRTGAEPTPSASEPANVLVFLGNESEARGPVELAVYVDGRVAVRRTVAPLATSTGYRDHESIPLRLSPGSHTVRVEAAGRAASVTAQIVVSAHTTYVSATYWYEPGGRHGAPIPEAVELLVQDRPFGFC